MSSGVVQWVKLELDLSEFDSGRYADISRSVVDSGIVMSSLAREGNTATNRRRLYELNTLYSADIPERGEFHTWDEYQQIRLQSPSFDPEGVVLAMYGDEWVGMSGLSHRYGVEYAFAEMTGTTASYRGQGIATAMKIACTKFARRIGVSSIRTVHHPENFAMIALNRGLGFRDASWDYPVRQ